MTNRYRHFFLALIAIDLLFVLLHILFGRQYDLFNLDREYNLPTYWSGLKFTALAAVSAGVAYIMQSRKERILWGILAAFFLYIAFDDISEVHEHITYYINAFVQPVKYFRSPTFMWLVFFSPMIVAGLSFLIAFFRRLRITKQERAIAWTGIACFAFALFLEFSSGALLRAKLFLRTEVILEEFSELAGATLFLVFLVHLAEKEFFQRYQRREKNV